MKLSLAIARSHIARREEERAAREASAQGTVINNDGGSSNDNNGGAGEHDKENANAKGDNGQQEQAPPPTPTSYTAYIGNMAYETACADIDEFFRGHQLVAKSIDVIEDKHTKTAKGFAFVEFTTLEGLKKAIELTGSVLCGRDIRISVAYPRKCSFWAKIDKATNV